MATMILIRNSTGITGRCDATCYNAHRPRCRCICAGKNHGVGYDQAVTNTPDVVDRLLEAKLQPDEALTSYYPDQQTCHAYFG